MHIIRPATLNDIPTITEIYNHAILHTVNTFDTIPKTAVEQTKWYESHRPHYPILVAELEGKVVGWTAVSKWQSKPAYSKTVVASIYVHPDHRRQGIAKALVMALIEAAYTAGFHAIVIAISQGNEASVKLAQACGFTLVGVLKEIGYKFDQWIDVHLMQHTREP
ncbi:MAG: N-acetyltransferase [Chloroflexi bacterium]|nr:N-acetyltransferase [Chloroflexota bacterium]